MVGLPAGLRAPVDATAHRRATARDTGLGPRTAAPKLLWSRVCPWSS